MRTCLLALYTSISSMFAAYFFNALLRHKMPDMQRYVMIIISHPRSISRESNVVR